MSRYRVTLGLALLSVFAPLSAFAQPARQPQALVVQPLQRSNIEADDRFDLVLIACDARLQTVDYPDVIASEGVVETIAVATVPAAFNRAAAAEKQERVKCFIDALPATFEDVQTAPRHPKWLDVNIAATPPGWTRFKAADDWLKTERTGTIAATPEFNHFVAEGCGDAVFGDREELFQQFIEWQCKQRCTWKRDVPAIETRVA